MRRMMMNLLEKKHSIAYHLQKKHSGNLLRDLLKIVCAGGDDAWDQYDYWIALCPTF